MSLSGSNSGGVGYGGCYLREDWSATQDPATNTSTITLWLYLIVGAGTSVSATESGNIYIDGNGSGYSRGSTYRSAGTYLLHSYSVTISHNSDGTRTFSSSGAFTSGWSTLGTLGVSGSWTLDTIPRASTPTLSAGSTPIEQSVTIYTNRLSPSFNHTIRLAFGGYSVTLATGVATSYAWNTATNKASLYAQIPNANSGVGTVYLDTYSGATLIGTKTVGITLTVANSNPTFANFTYSDTNSAITALTGNNQVAVKGKSTITAVISVANKMVAINSATNVKYNGELDGASVDGAYSASANVSLVMGAIANSGTKRLNVRAYDSRNNSTLVYKDITVYDYVSPVINATVTRLNNFENDTTIVCSGTYDRLVIGGTNKNAIATLQYRYKEVGGSFGSWVNFTKSVNTTTGTYTTTNVALNLDNTKQYQFEIQIIDSLETIVNTYILDAGIPIVWFGKDKQIGINMKPTNNNLGLHVLPTDNIFNLIYPVGSIYMSVASTNPATFFGGTWTVWGTGRTPVGVDTGQTEFNTIEKTGGEKAHTLTTAEMPVHNHAFQKGNTTGNAYETLYQGGANGTMGNLVAGTSINQGYTSIGNTGSGTAHNVLQPYITVYMWKRTA